LDDGRVGELKIPDTANRIALGWTGLGPRRRSAHLNSLPLTADRAEPVGDRTLDFFAGDISAPDRDLCRAKRIDVQPLQSPQRP
jgi:hypothetical protein